MKNKIISYIKSKANKNNIILNINKDFTEKQRKVAIVYVHQNFTQTYENVYHTQFQESAQIIKYFIDNDYSIDVINCHEENAIDYLKNIKYDVIFGLGDVFYEMCLINKNALKIMYLTENHPEFSYKKEMERIEYFMDRRNKKNRAIDKYVSRSNVYFKKKHFEVIDKIITMGNGAYLEKYYTINPTGLVNKEFEFEDENISINKKTFLWFGSNGAIHKGLDIVYEIFLKRDDINLIICGLNLKEQKKLRIKEQKNIKIFNKVEVKSKLFLQICKESCWVLYPSCSEAMSTSVLTCMMHGVIPIVIKENGFDRLEDNAFYLENYKVEYIEKYISRLILMDDLNIKKIRKKIFDFSEKKFSINNFNKNIKAIFEDIGV
ncbi:glycosyltransferase [Clostridium gasigenes]|uniref:Glycosyl transferases group 1 n=1 Tax=Clostridium gasigenes TaxID=94869 RepID=A0A1H0PNI6_9CLOT|nr:glycosyltransferase [Clostridium gasigenes]SDP06603.1 Glycosyl transferases group 1 [Clostridium gasigenes]